MQFIRLSDMMINASKIVAVSVDSGSKTLYVRLEEGEKLKLTGEKAIEFLEDLEKISPTGLSPDIAKYLEQLNLKKNRAKENEASLKVEITRGSIYLENFFTNIFLIIGKEELDKFDCLQLKNGASSIVLKEDSATKWLENLSNAIKEVSFTNDFTEGVLSFIKETKQKQEGTL